MRNDPDHYVYSDLVTKEGNRTVSEAIAFIVKDKRDGKRYLLKDIDQIYDFLHNGPFGL